MELNKIVQNSYNKWVDDDAHLNHYSNYNLDENSKVMELGGYDGTWSSIINNKFNCNIYIIEPVKHFYQNLVDKFNNFEKIKIKNIGISTENESKNIYLSNDSTSTEVIQNTSIEKCNFLTIDSILEEFNIEYLDLIQINIEGDEYKILNYFFDKKLINKFKNIQVQFHINIKDCESKRKFIHEQFLKNNFKLKYEYPFIWECWTQI